MKKLTLLTAIFLCSLSSLDAQLNSKKITFSSITRVALAVGESNNAFTVQTINGIHKDKWFAGLGAGIDFYGRRSIPLFISVQREFLPSAKRLFVYADGGINYRWLQSNDYYKYNSGSTPGLYYEGGIGWKIYGKNNTAFMFSAGFSVKQVKETIFNYWYNFGPTFADNNEQYNYHYRRIMIRLGVQL